MGGLKGLFIKEDESSKPKEVDIKAEAVKATKEIEAAGAALPSPSINPEIEEMTKQLVQVLEQNQSADFDYLKFHSSVKELVAGGQSEVTAMNSVFTIAKTMGATKTKLITSAKNYIKLIDGAKADFDKDRAKAESEATTTEAEIKALTKEIEEKKKRKETLETSLVNSRARINSLSFAFGEAYNNIVAGITGEMEKINTTLK